MKSYKTISRLTAFLLVSVMVFMLAACGNTGNVPNNDVRESEEQISGGQATDVSKSETDENMGTRPSDVSNIVEQADVPLITLNNGVQMPQLGLGTQIQSLEGDSSEEGRELLNSTTHDAVVAALQAGYRHLDTAHGYYNEYGVGQGIIDSGVSREEIWLTSKLWPSEYGEGVTMEAIDQMLERLRWIISILFICIIQWGTG